VGTPTPLPQWLCRRDMDYIAQLEGILNTFWAEETDFNLFGDWYKHQLYATCLVKNCKWCRQASVDEFISHNEKLDI
jgi:hypothetical protein